MEERATVIAEGRIIDGKIRLERPLARGGMGAVWVAHHLKLDAPVAVKFMDPELAASASARARFEREAKAAAQLQSPWVVRVQDYGVEGDTPYIIMELLVGEDMGQRLQKKGRLSLAELSPIVDQVCRALRRAHEAGLVHRDLKPGNIFLARQGHEDEEVVKLLDFGIAKLITPGTPQSGDVTRSGNLVGSPLYMSPEQIRKSKEVDHRSDLWSLAVILYQALTGRTPFAEEDIGAVLVAICTDPISPPSTLLPSLGPAVDAFFERALARSPASRFQSAREIHEAFAALAGERRSHLSPKSAQDEVDVSAPTERGANLALRGGSSLELAKTAPSVDTENKVAAQRAPDASCCVTPNGTLSPSGVTQQEEMQGRSRRRRPVVAAALLIAAVFVGAWWIRGLSADPSAGGDRPGSPTLPLPPPSSTAAAVVTASAIATSEASSEPAPSSTAQALEPAPSGSPSARATTRVQAGQPRDDASTAVPKRDRPVGTKVNAAGAAAASAASDEKELGL